MKTIRILLFIFILFTACSYSAEEKDTADFNKAKSTYFHEIKLPTNNPPRIFGFNAAGCLDGAVSLPIGGEGYQIQHIHLKRYYGHPRLIKFIEKFAKEVHQLELGNIIVGDMSMPRGGPMLYGHFSHQTGLDVDFSYLRISDEDKEDFTIEDIETMKDDSIMTEDMEQLDPEKWDDSNITVLRICAEFEEVSVIYVSPIILRELCNKMANFNMLEEKWLYKIQPWHGHVDHYHVRLSCPPKNPECITSKIYTENSCGQKLDKWFTEEAKKKQKAYFMAQKKKKEKFKELPEQCQNVLEYSAE